MGFSEDRMDDFRADAIEEMRLDAEYEVHYAEHETPDADCWICLDNADEAE